jgi:hypothetical protein
MSKAFLKEDTSSETEEDAGAVPSMRPAYITPAGYKKLQQELAQRSPPLRSKEIVQKMPNTFMAKSAYERSIEGYGGYGNAWNPSRW